MTTSRGCKSHYFSIDNLLSTQELVPCTFVQNAKSIGFLEPGSTNNDIIAGSTLQLPHWIASCFTPYNAAINIDLPKAYKKVYRDVLKADAKVVELKKVSRYYYLFGKHLLRLKHREAPELQILLHSTFRERFRMILDWTQNMSSEHLPSKRLDRFETFILESGRESQSKLDSWLKGGTCMLEATSMIVGYKKRSKIDDVV